MPGMSDISRGNIMFSSLLMRELIPAASVPGNSMLVSTYDIKGLLLYDFVIIEPQEVLNPPLSISGAWVPAPHKLSVQWLNVTPATSTDTPQRLPCMIRVDRMSNASEGPHAFPKQFV